MYSAEQLKSRHNHDKQNQVVFPAECHWRSLPIDALIDMVAEVGTAYTRNYKSYDSVVGLMSDFDVLPRFDHEDDDKVDIHYRSDGAVLKFSDMHRATIKSGVVDKPRITISSHINNHGNLCITWEPTCDEQHKHLDFVWFNSHIPNWGCRPTNELLTIQGITELHHRSGGSYPPSPHRVQYTNTMTRIVAQLLSRVIEEISKVAEVTVYSGVVLYTHESGDRWFKDVIISELEDERKQNEELKITEWRERFEEIYRITEKDFRTLFVEVNKRCSTKSNLPTNMSNNLRRKKGKKIMPTEVEVILERLELI